MDEDNFFDNEEGETWECHALWEEHDDIEETCDRQSACASVDGSQSFYSILHHLGGLAGLPPRT